MPVQPFIELALGVYFTLTVFYALAHGIYGTLPFLMLFQFGFLYTGLMSIFQQAGGDDLLIKQPQIASGNEPWAIGTSRPMGRCPRVTAARVRRVAAHCSAPHCRVLRHVH